MSEKQKSSNRVITLLTIIAAFLMGFIDAYTFMAQNHVFASAQTGNMVTFAVKLFSGEWRQAVRNIIVFFGFALGVFLGEIFLVKFAELRMLKYRLFLYFQAVLLLLLAIYQLQLDTRVMGVLLGILSGYELTMFRKIRDTQVNNGIMTGNAKNLMNSLYRILFNKEKKAKSDFLNQLTVIVMFIFGVGIGTLVVQWHATYSLWFAFYLVCLSIVSMFFVKE